MVKQYDKECHVVTLSQRTVCVLVGTGLLAAWLAVCVCCMTGQSLQEVLF